MCPTALFDFLQHSDKTIKPIKQIETRSGSFICQSPKRSVMSAGDGPATQTESNHTFWMYSSVPEGICTHTLIEAP